MVDRPKSHRSADRILYRRFSPGPMGVTKIQKQGLLITAGWIGLYMLLSIPFDYDLFEQGYNAVMTGAAIGAVYTYIQNRRGA
jgi:hypothetical protein